MISTFQHFPDYIMKSDHFASMVLHLQHLLSKISNSQDLAARFSCCRGQNREVLRSRPQYLEI